MQVWNFYFRLQLYIFFYLNDVKNCFCIKLNNLFYDQNSWDIKIYYVGKIWRAIAMFSSNNAECSIFFHSESNEFLQLFIWPFYNLFFIFAAKCNFYPETFQTKLQEVLDFLISSTVIGTRKSVFFCVFAISRFYFYCLHLKKCYVTFWLNSLQLKNYYLLFKVKTFFHVSIF